MAWRARPFEPRKTLAVLIAIIGAAGVSAAMAVEDEAPDVTWTMVDVTTADLQGDAHLIEIGAKTILIDAGPEATVKERLLPFLRSRGIGRLDAVYLSHMHEDHVGGLDALVDAGIEIERVWVSIPDEDICVRERPWGCDPARIEELLSELASAGIPVDEPEVFDSWEITEGATLRVLSRLDGNDSGLGPIDVNDTSLVLALDVGSRTLLFTGDINEVLGADLAQRDLDLEEEVLLKVPHHGVEGVPPDAFFDHVDPEHALVPAPAALFCSERSARVRTWLRRKHVATWVSGVSGHVTVHIEDDKEIDVVTERPGRADRVCNET